MRREYVIAILLAVAAIPSGATLMVAPNYLDLNGRVVPATFWGGIWLTVVLISAAVVVALRGEAKSIRETSMTPADIGYNAALVAATASVLAAFRRYPRVAVIAAVLAWVGIGIDYWFGPPRTFIGFNKNISGDDVLRMGLHGSPMGWSQLYINNTILAPPGKPMNISDLTIMGGNVGTEEIKLDDAYFISGIDGTRLDVKIGWGGAQYKIQEIKPIPPGAFVFIFSDPVGPKDFSGISQDEFLKTWAITNFVVRYNGATKRVTFDREAVKSALPKPMDPYPHIAPLKEH